MVANTVVAVDIVSCDNTRFVSAWTVCMPRSFLKSNPVILFEVVLRTDASGANNSINAVRWPVFSSSVMLPAFAGPKLKFNLKSKVSVWGNGLSALMASIICAVSGSDGNGSRHNSLLQKAISSFALIFCKKARLLLVS